MATPQEIGTLPWGPQLPFQFLDVVPVLPVDKDRWMVDGITWVDRPYGRVLNRTSTSCTPGDRTTVPRGCTEPFVQKSFQVNDALRLTALNLYALGFDSSDDALEVFNRVLSASLASELMTATGSTGHSLKSTATAPAGLAFGSAATPLWNAIAVIESELASRLLGEMGVIHLTPGLFGRAATEGIIKMVDGVWQTHLGNLVIADAGYIDAPAPAAGGSASAAGEDWIYGSGSVWRLLTTPKTTGDAFNPSNFAFDRNLMQKWTDAVGLLAFSPALVTAALSSYSTEG